MSRKLIKLDPPLSEEQLQELLDLFYADSARASLVKFGIWKPAEREVE